ncbi:MAG: ATP-binding protein [bacterium]|nr:ATP-binding protein [bacterium]
MGDYAFLHDGGELGRMIEAHDWSATALGPIVDWPIHLKAIISVMLRAPLPMALLWGESGKLIYNDGYAVVAGGRHPEILGMPVRDAWPEASDFNDNVVRQCLAGATLTFSRQELTLYRNGAPEQVFMDLNYSPVLDANGQPVGVLGVVIETTNVVLVERDLRSETQALEMLHQTGAALAAELDLEPLVQMVTDAGVSLTGAQFGAYFHNMMDETGERLHLFTLSGADRSAFEGLGRPRPTAVFGPTFRNEGVIRSDDILADPRYGHNAPFNGMPPGHLPVRSYLAVPVAARSGEVLGGLLFGHSDTARFTERHEMLVVGVAAQAAVAIDNARLFRAVQEMNDTLEQRVSERTDELTRAHEALQQAQKMEALGQLTGGMAHDFNNLLTVIRGSTDLLRRPGLTDERRDRYIDAIAQTADRATKLTSQLLAFARRSSLTPSIFDVGTTIRGLNDMMSMLAGSFITVDLQLPETVCSVNADVSQFETAIVNMAINARDAMEQRGSLIIVVEQAAYIPAVRGHGARVGDYVAIAITDSGCGIPPEHIDQIFEPFFTSKAVGHGTGLGLSQVFGFAKQSGGDIIASSRLGEGSTFTLYLPRASCAPETVPIPVVETTDHGRHYRILVVEDNKEVGMFAAAALGDLGHDSVRAGDAQEALALLKRGESQFDVIFSDVMMPGMNGVEFAQEVRRTLPDMPILLTSGYSEVISRQGTQGFDLLRKP